MNNIPTIGLEIHVQLATKSKLFCSCSNEGFGATPNTNVCPVCLGHPGTLPVPNRKAIEFILLAGIAFGSEISQETKFDRKNYFYPDLPKGYQISQYDQPFCEGGRVVVDSRQRVEGSEESDAVRLTRIHLEEDAGKLIHPTGVSYSLVDFNRAGTPLVEIVTEPEIHSADEAVAIAKKIQETCRYLGISKVDMEKGQMRFDINVNLKDGERKITEITEVKNLNSFKSLKKAIDFELERHREAFLRGEKLIHETRGWDDENEVSIMQRSKEDAPDYRYFPEPDIPMIKIDAALLSRVKRMLPEMADKKLERFIEEYGLSKTEAKIIVANKAISEFFEKTASECLEWVESFEGEISRKDEAQKKIVKLVSNWLLSELFSYLKEEKLEINQIKITPENFAELVALIYEKKINSSAGQKILREMFETGNDPSHIMNEKNLKQVDDIDELSLVCDQVILDNKDVVKRIKSGDQSPLQFLVGQVMAKTRGSANPQKTLKILKDKIKR